MLIRLYRRDISVGNVLTNLISIFKVIYIKYNSIRTLIYVIINIFNSI